MHFSPCPQHLCGAISDLWFTRKPEDPKRKAHVGCQLDDPGIERPERFERSHTLRQSKHFSPCEHPDGRNKTSLNVWDGNAVIDQIAVS
jgi:hypothetical protein